MPRRTDIGSIMVIGAGPIVIGQACEFDYSGTQACKALKDEGYRVILVNSNPATIMTDPEFADATYIEPITPDIVGRIVAAEKPDALLPTMGGQTALNTALALADDGTLARHGVDLIGASQAAIEVAEDREAFREAMKEIGLECPKSRIARSLDEARQALDLVGLPTIIRPSYTLGGTGGGIAYNRAEFAERAAAGIDASPAGEILVEESVLGWKEFEMEVVRDKADNAIIVCSIENLDPMGIHTGDSITVAPALTLTDKEYQLMRNAAIAVLRKVGVETGGLQRPVRRRSGHRPAGGDRDEPAGLALVGPRLQGHRVPHRQGRGQARGRLHPRRDRERHHRCHARLLRARHRLCGDQGPALRVREVSGRRAPAHHLDEIGGRGHGDRAHLLRIAAESAALHGDRAHRPRRDRHSRRRRRAMTRRSSRRSASRGPIACS